MHRFLITCFAALPVVLSAQAPAAPQTERPSTESSAAPALPVRRVVLYKAGVGYFEHLGTVRNRQDVTVRFTSAQLNDVLNSLTVLDFGRGQITGISYNSVAPVEQRLGALRLPLGESTTQVQMLNSLRGARVDVTSGGVAIEGRLLSVESRMRQRGDERIPVDTVSVITDGGEMRTFELSPTTHVRILERDLRQEVGRYLDLVGSTREQDVRNMVISTNGAGDRQLFVSYVSEVPIWKSTYRLVLSAKGKPLLQGWAIVDNTIGEDWRSVELSLVAGAPQSFIQNISQPYYGRRSVVPMPSTVLSAPQTHQASLGDGAGMVRGVVRDVSRSVLPGATVQLLGASGVAAITSSRNDGSYEITAPAGIYTLRFELAGFNSQVFENWRMPSGSSVQQDVTMQVGGVSESVRVTADAVTRLRKDGIVGGVPGGTVGGVAGGTPAAPPPPASAPMDIYSQARIVEPQAASASLGDLFEYRIKEPITLRKNQSALVPILSAEIEAEKVSLWNRTSGSGRPLRAVWLTNSSGLTLDGGSITLIDSDAFAGEGLLEPLKPGEKRLLSYAADLGVLVDARRQTGDSRIVRLRARDGIITQETEERVTSTYKARNENATPTTLIIEHRLNSGWRLSEGQTPVESTTDAQRFRVVLSPGKETVHEVREMRQGETRIMVGDVDEVVIAQLVKSGVSAAALEGALKPVLDKRIELARVEQRLDTLQQSQAAIATDQQRLRENMKALRGSAEEKQLLQRYTRQLDEQETRLETLRAEMTRATAEAEKLRVELANLIGSVSFDLSASR
ncbi:MAG TPA: carboxypeptidase regulatory-like domain-containing protein [Vicinamibacterales bacterium]|nr:carboxypeptidase regulatory-like domain-containing protein [Vicinamibacterales bacterium]